MNLTKTGKNHFKFKNVVVFMRGKSKTGFLNLHLFYCLLDRFHLQVVRHFKKLRIRPDVSGEI